MHVGIVTDVLHYGARYQYLKSFDRVGNKLENLLDTDIQINLIKRLVKHTKNKEIRLIGDDIINLRNRLIHEKRDVIVLYEAISRKGMTVDNVILYTNEVMDKSNNVLIRRKVVDISWHYIYFVIKTLYKNNAIDIDDIKYDSVIINSWRSKHNIRY